MECSICCEKYNKSNRKKIECSKSEECESVCQSCVKRYIVEKKEEEIVCMYCKKEWEEEYIMKVLPKTFINKEYKEYREEILLEEQLARMPETQEYALKVKKEEELMSKKKKIEEEMYKLREETRRINQAIEDIRKNMKIKKESCDGQKFSYKCQKERCEGFLNNKYKCGLCETEFCKECLEEKKEDHVCDEEKKETIKLLKKDTKPCPKCGEQIYKIDGCDQMWCTSCHTAYSWRTGKIETKIHNPEYYRWMRERGDEIPREEEVDNNNCDFVNYTTLINILRMCYPPKILQNNRIEDSPKTLKILNMHRIVRHINARIDRTTEDHERYTLEMRTQYLLNRMTKNEMKRKLRTTEKKNNKTRRINNVWDLLKIVLIEYIGRIVENSLDHENLKETIEDTIKETENIKEYCNKQFEGIGKKLNMIYPGISNEWIEIPNWNAYILRHT